MKLLRYILPFVLLLSFGNGFSQSKEQVYAGIILHIMKYVEWPSDKAKVMTVGVVNDAQLTAALNKASAGRKVHFKDIRIIKYSGVGNLNGCHILFLPRKSIGLIEEIRTSATLKSIMIITEKKPAGTTGVCINFVELQGKLRFELYRATVKSTGLKVSEQLTKFAIVKG